MSLLRVVHSRTRKFSAWLLVLLGWMILSSLFLMKFWLGEVAFSWDDSLHGLYVYQHVGFFRSILDTGKWNWFDFFSLSPYYSPLVYILTGLTSLIWGYSVWTLGAMMVGFYLGSLMLFFFFLKALKQKTVVAFVMVMLFSLLAPTISYAQSFLLEMPLLFFLLCFYYQFAGIINNPNHKNRNLVFLFAGLTLLVKWTALVYVLVPLSWHVFSEYKRHGLVVLLHRHWWGMLIFWLITFPWYMTNFRQ